MSCFKDLIYSWKSNGTWKVTDLMLIFIQSCSCSFPTPGNSTVRISPGLIAECFFGWLDYWCFPKTIFSASEVELQIWSHLWKFLLNSMLASFSCSSWTLLGICVKIRLSRFATQWIIFRPDSWSTFFIIS